MTAGCRRKCFNPLDYVLIRLATSRTQGKGGVKERSPLQEQEQHRLNDFDVKLANDAVGY